MTKSEAQIKAEEYLEDIQKGCPVEIALNHDVTEEHAIGFVFFYNSVEYWHSRDFSKSLAGNGPILVLRPQGSVIILPSNQSVKRSLHDLFQLGDLPREVPPTDAVP